MNYIIEKRETFGSGRTYYSVVECCGCAQVERLNVATLSESFREPAYEALLDAFKKIHRGCAPRLRLVTKIKKDPEE